MPFYDVQIPGEFRGNQTYRIKARSVAEALRAVRDGAKAFQDGRCVSEEVECIELDVNNAEVIDEPMAEDDGKEIGG